MKASAKHKRKLSKRKFIMAKKTQITLTQQAQIEDFEAFNKALLAALALGAVQAADVDSMIVAAGFAVSEAEHEAAKPIDKKAAALAALAAFMPAKATADKLAMSYGTLAKALGKLECHIDKPLHDNGTSLVTHHIAQGLLNGQKRFSIGEIIAKVNETYTMPKGVPYASTGHINTVKALLKKAGFNVQSPSGFFIVSE